jgi:hypothetical protein
VTARRRHEAPTYAAQFYPDGVLATYEVTPWRKGVLWRLEYLCACGHQHRHSGGDGDLPAMGNSIWFSDCPLAPEFAPMVRLVLPKDWTPA